MTSGGVGVGGPWLGDTQPSNSNPAKNAMTASFPIGNTKSKGFDSSEIYKVFLAHFLSGCFRVFSKKQIAYVCLGLSALFLVIYVLSVVPASAVMPSQTVTLPPVTITLPPVPTVAGCTDGEQKEFACVGEISGTQTYYECVDGGWESKSRFNRSACVKIAGPWAPWEENQTANGTAGTGANETAGQRANQTADSNATLHVESAFPSQNASAGPGGYWRRYYS